MSDALKTIKIWILGAGKFGQKAVQTLSAKFPNAQIDLVDRKPSAPVLSGPNNIRSHKTDAIHYLYSRLENHHTPDLIVPAVPLHVAFEWIRTVLTVDRVVEKVPIPKSLQEQLPCLPAPEIGRIYLSLADFRCPDDCCEPERYCTHTGQPRPYDLFQKLSEIRLENYVSVVVRSRQLGPGIGGYRPQDLFNALDRVQTARSAVLLSTACRCHGVLDPFFLLE